MGSTRRQFLLAGGAAAALAACGSKGGSSTKGTTPGSTVVARFPNTPLFTPGALRLAVSLADSSGTLQTSGPASLKGAVLDSSNKVVTETTAAIRAKDIVNPYYPFRFTISTPGVYTLRVEGDDGGGAAFQVFEPSAVQEPIIGGTLPPFDTPTVSDHRGVNPYCSLQPAPCPLHDVTLTQALASGKHVAYMVGTPAHCQTGTCAPALQSLVAQRAGFADRIVMVHADVYTDDSATQLAPAVTALHLDYEPVLYLCTAQGKIVDRLDGIWDATEVADALKALVS